MSGLSVVIPAHNEESVIVAALDGILDGGPGTEVIVVANGCTDATVARVRAAHPGVRVIDLPAPSKIAAINAGLDAATAYPVAVVDADVRVSGEALREIARRMDARPEAAIGSPAMRVEPSSSWAVRQYYRVWALTDYRSTGHVGSGVYILSRAGRERLGAFPDVIADDLFAQRLFSTDERETAGDVTFSVRAPGSIRALLHRNTRIAAGNRQLARDFPRLAAPGGGTGARSLVRRIARRPSLWAGFLIYTGVYLTAHRRARALVASRSPIAWNRDDTTRTDAR